MEKEKTFQPTANDKKKRRKDVVMRRKNRAPDSHVTVSCAHTFNTSAMFTLYTASRVIQFPRLFLRAQMA